MMPVRTFPVRWALLALVPLVLSGCQRDPTGRDGGLRTDEFVNVIVELRTAERELERDEALPSDSMEVEFERRRTEILERYGATEDDLLDYVQRHHTRPGLMADVWDTITNRLRTSPEELGADHGPKEGVR